MVFTFNPYGAPSPLTRLEAAARAGDGDAALDVARHYLAGRGVSRDLSKCRAWLGVGAKAGNETAILGLAAFEARGTGGAADWTGALDTLALLDRRPRARSRRERDLIDAMALDSEGNPTRDFSVETVTDDPLIRRVPAFASDEEIAFLLELGKPALQPSLVVDPQTGQQRPDPVRTSRNTAFPWINERPFINALNRRIAHVSGFDQQFGEPLQLLHYSGDQQYKRHHDAIPGADNQRVATALLYLNEDYDGGETAFPDLDMKIKGRKGELLIFSNVDEKAAPHPLAWHTGEPVTRGQKFVATRWIREKPFGPRA
ncbi:2OG-Fe(II) oxygenase [Sphingomicrobium arenosum]|uniref:2OG-Fe(II) oxygenase n=1 Tax=Sphingomicrobium arenosum TaxID=2233861 RepID=UPI00223EED29|nr:2OG-Fe(II) oxygenase [Sphingomicrobium arenosum]